MDLSPDLQHDMAATAVAAQQPQSGPKRYRPAPAKTFQCRGYGECRMVFSRSEHLARHIRKHTGERPFTCHCGKQFSRLDNLRQHAQTVHADKQDQNERMMRDLTSLHASMAAANKIASARGGRRHNPVTAVKQEELAVPLHQRPGTSTGYEGDHDTFLYNQRNHSFRDSSQSFLGPPAPSAAAGAAPGQSFLPFAFTLPDRDARPRTSVSGGLADPNSRSLPPLAAVVSASLSASAQQHLQPFPAPPGSSHGQPGGNSLLLPGSLTLRRPTTATRPGTAPASASFFSATGMAFSRPELSLARTANPVLGSSCDPEPSSPGGNDASPFFFSPPSVDPAPAAASPPTVLNPRKRRADDDAPPPASRDSTYDYEYGSESRPQSRRLSVMELCNDDAGVLLPSTRSAESRPTTSGLVSSASALALVDRPSPTLTASPVYPRSSAQYPPPPATTRGNGSGQEEFSGTDRIFSALRRHIPSPSSVLPYRSGPSGTSSAVSTFAYSPPFSSASPTTTASYVSPRSSASPFSPRSPLSGPDAAANALHRRTPLADDPGAQHDQIRFVRPSQHPSPALGLRV
ncbi:hypothetical protein AGABI1DRAFT_125783 [Agaricus bisporus var. burnettii JB137-S8]|uniref:C2H2-type domain-containing protein n=1 Tax=Agaricus bisporus var. burnettii (strain JB137-S8 / ATCC MYA-4627 / FGSC 10392) TaxID=597362 RepID=K5W8Z1_AGABU|nr:uncharacterized protein AGABI1DRAFT_125783 [Agaricus bisporus var. burnettii JB137-S8]EKM83329.1 hypothetical protein AGABI1DRAFT_125783 [Agaricus bisporus var. burnettii JB137-S8]